MPAVTAAQLAEAEAQPEAALALVEARWQLRDHAGVLSLTERFLELWPDQGRLYLFRGEALGRQRRYDEAYRVLDRGIEAAARQDDLQMLADLQSARGGLLVRQGRLEEGKRQLELSVRTLAAVREPTHPLDSCPYMALGRIYRLEGRDQAALEVLIEGAERVPEHPYVVIAAYQQALRANEVARAAQVLAEAPHILAQRRQPVPTPWMLEEDAEEQEPLPDDRDALLVATLVAWREGRRALASSLLAELVGLEPDGRVMLLRSLALIQQGDLEAAELLLGSLNASSPESPGPLVGMGHLAIARHQLDAALLLLEQAHTEEPWPTDEPAASWARFLSWLRLVGRGWCLANSGRFDEASTAFERALELHPDDPQALVGLGNARMALGDLDASEAAFRAAIARDPQNANALAGVGMVAFHRGDDQTAEAVFSQTLSETPATFSCPYEGLGLLYLRRGEEERAVPLLEQAVQAEPEVGFAKYLGLARLRLRDGDLDRAEALVERALANDPENAEASALLAEIEARRSQGGGS